MLCSTCHALDISNLTWKRNPVWFHQNQWQLTPKKFTLELILQPFPSAMLSFGSAVTPHPRWRNNHSCISISELWANIPAAPSVSSEIKSKQNWAVQTVFWGTVGCLCTSAVLYTGQGREGKLGLAGHMLAPDPALWRQTGSHFGSWLSLLYLTSHPTCR